MSQDFGPGALGSFRDAAARAARQGVLGHDQPPVAPGTVQRNSGDPTQSGAPSQGGSRREVKQDLLVTTFLTGASANYPTVAEWRVFIPSGRLAWLIGWTFEPDGAEDATFPAALPTAWVVTADAWIEGQKGLTRNMRGNRLLTNQAIPTTYESGGSLIREVRGTVTVPASAGVGVGVGKLWLTATWEPAPGWAPNDEELRRLFNTCRVQAKGITAPVSVIG